MRANILPEYVRSLERLPPINYLDSLEKLSAHEVERRAGLRRSLELMNVALVQVPNVRPEDFVHHDIIMRELIADIARRSLLCAVTWDQDIHRRRGSPKGSFIIMGGALDKEDQLNYETVALLTSATIELQTEAATDRIGDVLIYPQFRKIIM